MGIDSEEQGTPSQITSHVKFIKNKEVPALFLESNVDPRPMEAVWNRVLQSQVNYSLMRWEDQVKKGAPTRKCSAGTLRRSTKD